MSLETREIKLCWRDIPGFAGISRWCTKSLRKKKSVFNFWPLMYVENPIQSKSLRGAYQNVLLQNCFRGARGSPQEMGLPPKGALTQINFSGISIGDLTGVSADSPRADGYRTILVIILRRDGGVLSTVGTTIRADREKCFQELISENLLILLRDRPCLEIVIVSSNFSGFVLLAAESCRTNCWNQSDRHQFQQKNLKNYWMCPFQN